VWKRAKGPTALREAGYLLLGVVSLAAVTGLYFWLDVPLAATAFTYLVVLVLLALVSHFSSLIVLSLIGGGCLNYFFTPPIYSFRVDYPQDLVTISVFVITSFVANFLVTRVRGEQRDRRRSEAYLTEAQRLSHTGTWVLNPTTMQYLYWSDESYRIWGFDPLQGFPSRDSLWQRIHDRDKVWEEIQEAVRQKKDYSGEFKIVLPNGTVKYLTAKSHHLFGTNGELVEVIGTNVDVTERNRAEEALRESEYKLRQIIETVPGLVWSNGPDGEPTHVNQRMLDYSGMSYEKFKLHRWDVFVHPADYPETAEAFRHAIQTGTPYQGVTRLRRADGEFRWHHARCEPLCDRQGRIIQWYGLSVDIDERKRAEDQLRRSEAYLADAERLTHFGSLAYNDTAILYFSDETYRIFGFDPREGLPSREAVVERVQPDDRERALEEIRKAVEQKKDYALDFRIVLPDGTVKYTELKAHPRFSPSGELVEVVSTIIDVTERKRTERALRESRAHLAEARHELRQMIDNIPILVVRYSIDARREFVNAAWKQYTGLSDEAALGTDWSIVAHPDDLATGEKMWRETLARGEPVHTEVRLRRADGQYRWFAVDRVALRDESGKVIKWYGTAHDIEQRKRAERALQESEARARSAIDGIAGLIAIMSPNGELETVNRQVFEYFGRSLEELKNWATSDAVHPEDLPHAIEIFTRAVAPGFPTTTNNACGASMANIDGLTSAASQFAMTPGASRAGTF